MKRNQLHSSLMMELIKFYIHHPGLSDVPNGYDEVPDQVYSDANEFRLTQYILEELRHIIKISSPVLTTQDVYWICFTPISCEEQRKRITQVIENHRRTPVKWLTNGKIEITIDPVKRIKNKRL